MTLLANSLRFIESHPLWLRLLIIVGLAVAAHTAAWGISRLTRGILRRWFHHTDKPRTLIQFGTSVVIATTYFVALGFGLTEIGLPVGTYIASATVLGLAFSFGSQLLVQDVISGLTLIFADLIDVGDMVDIGGQIGIIEHVGVRYTRLANFAGASVHIPNRNVANVIRYPDGYTRAYLDIQILVADDQRYLDAIESTCRSAAAQFPGAILLPPDLARSDPAAGGAQRDIVRAKFRIWPGQSALIGGAVRSAVLAALRELDPAYPDWQVTLVERSEMDRTRPTLPAPTGVMRRRGLSPARSAPPGRNG